MQDTNLNVGLGLKPEQFARIQIDKQLLLCGWIIQDVKRIDFSAGVGIAVRELQTGEGPADYMLFIDRMAVGIIEAKPEGTTLSGIADQNEKYIANFPDSIPHAGILPFAYESTGTETYFRDRRDPETRSRRVFTFHHPETLREWLENSQTLRGRLKELPPLNQTGLRKCQTEAIINLENSIANAHPRALIQMATGTGKTFTAVTFVYRLIKHAHAKRILFLVDRKTLGRQTRGEFAQFRTPDDGRLFTDLYNVQLLTSNAIDPVANVCITTIQRLYSMLCGQEIEDDLEEISTGEITDESAPPKEVIYNKDIPIETFDFVITDECHRSIYNQWRQVLEYFDAFIIGLTATPSKQTFGFFNQNLVMEYNHERAVADRVNVGYEIYRIKTQITEQGSKVESGFYIDRRDRQTRKVRWELLDEDLNYTANQLDRDVVTPDQIRTVIRTFRDKLFTEIFPERTEVPKTLVFAKDDSHAEDIVNIIREEFGKGNDFCKKITYRTTGDTPENLIAGFRNSYNPRIAVTVDMISTGTDIKPLECLLFMRNIKSQVYFEQMKGRGTRTIDNNDLRAVTPDVKTKDHFVIVDAVGVTESLKTDSRPLERKPSVPFDVLLNSVALGQRNTDTLMSLAGRLSRMGLNLDPEQEQAIVNTAGKSLPAITNDLLNCVDPDKIEEKAKTDFQTSKPTLEQIKQTTKKIITDACLPFDKPDFRDLLKEIKRRQDQIIDTVSQDTVLSAGFNGNAAEKAAAVVKSLREFIAKNKDEITALQIIYNQPYDKRQLTYEMIKGLAKAMENPPYNLNAERVWQSFAQLEKDKVRKRGSVKMLTDIIALIRFGIGKSPSLIPFQTTTDQRFAQWLNDQQAAGNRYSPEQLEWLNLIKAHIAKNVEVTRDDFDNVPFYEHGGLLKAYQVFGKRFEQVIKDLNEKLTS